MHFSDDAHTSFSYICDHPLLPLGLLLPNLTTPTDKGTRSRPSHAKTHHYVYSATAGSLSDRSSLARGLKVIPNALHAGTVVCGRIVRSIMTPNLLGPLFHSRQPDSPPTEFPLCFSTYRFLSRSSGPYFPVFVKRFCSAGENHDGRGTLCAIA